MKITYGAISSSQDPEQIANKVKGVVLALSSIIILVAGRFFGIQLSANDMISLATEAGIVSGAVWAIYGGILHVLAIIFKKEVV